MKTKAYALNAMIALLFLSNSFLMLLPLIIIVSPLFQLQSVSWLLDPLGPLGLILNYLSLKPALFGFLLMLLSWLFYAVYVDLGVREEPGFRSRMALLFLLCIAQTVTPAYYFTSYFGAIVFV